MSWATDYRIDWIRESVLIFGFINREHVMAKFRVSTPQASKDLNDTIRRWPYLMSYDRSAKRYVKTPGLEYLPGYTAVSVPK